MQAERFIILVDQVLDILKEPSHKEAFVDNLHHLGKDEMKFSEWIMTYLAWSELGSAEDVASYHWDFEEEG